MGIEEILALEDKKQMGDLLCRDTMPERDVAAYIDEYKGKRTRRATSVDLRENKEIDVFSDTETTLDVDGNKMPKKIGTKTILSAKVHTNIPKRVVRTAAAFLFGGDMVVSFAETNDGSQHFKELTEDKLKLKSALNMFARTVMTETKSAILFYPAPGTDDEGKPIINIRLRVLSNKNGEFYPHFDDYENMDAFVRRYKATYAADGKEHDFVWIQTAEKEISYVDLDGTLTLLPEKPNLAKKITVVYAEQDAPEWEDVAVNLDALEMRLSRLIDTNDYFSEPILKSYGATALPSKSTVGKQIEFEVTIDPDSGKELHGDADYLVWQQSVDSIKLELDIMKGEIYSGTATPDLSFENMKSIGALSGSAMELMFIDAFVKAAEKMEIFGPAVIRCISIIKAMISNISETKYKNDLLKAKPKITFDTILPNNLKELVETLTKANGYKPINSQRTLVSRSPFTENAEEEMKQLDAEAQASARQNSLTGLNLTGS